MVGTKFRLLICEWPLRAKLFHKRCPGLCVVQSVLPGDRHQFCSEVSLHKTVVEFALLLTYYFHRQTGFYSFDSIVIVFKLTLPCHEYISGHLDLIFCILASQLDLRDSVVFCIIKFAGPFRFLGKDAGNALVRDHPDLSGWVIVPWLHLAVLC